MRATTEHLDALCELAPRIFANAARAFGEIEPDAMRATFASWLEGDDSRVAVATSADGSIVGVCAAGAGRVAFRRESVVVHVKTLWVTPEARGAGIAKQLLSEIESWACEIGAVVMLAGVPIDYSAHHDLGDRKAVDFVAASFYRRSGFDDVEIMMSKVLQCL